MQEVKQLEFDTKLFGYNVGYVRIADGNWIPDDILGKEIYDLIYIYSSIPILLVGGDDLNLVDIKVTWQKSLTVENILDPIEISHYSGSNDRDIQELALQSGEYSRFNLDKNFTNGEYFKLYNTWISKILKHELADEILVYMEDSRILGFVSIKLIGDVARIGLIAVNKSHRGRSIGTKLMVAAEGWALSNRAGLMIVSTQKHNTGAMELYKKCRYSILDEEYIYHIWKKN